MNKWDTSKFEAILRRLEAVCKTELEWGFFEDAVYPANHINPAAAGLPVATVALANEYGSHLAPSRPFFRMNIKEVFPMVDGGNRPPLVAPQLANIVQNAISNKGTGAPYRRLGVALQTSLKERIEDYGTQSGDVRPNNSAKWQAVKGFDDPLRQSGKMIESVDYRLATAGSP